MPSLRKSPFAAAAVAALAVVAAAAATTSADGASLADGPHHLRREEAAVLAPAELVTVDNKPAANAVRLKVSRRHRKKKVTSNSVDASVSLNDIRDLLWTCPVQVGTPAQTLQVDLDTGSSNFAVATASTKPKVTGTKVYKASASSTHKSAGGSVTVTYGSGAIQGPRVTDVVSLGGATINKFEFIAATREKGMYWGKEGAGLLGLAFDGIVVGKTEGFMHALAASGQLASPEVTFALGGSSPEVTIGGSDPTKYTGSAITVDAVRTNSFWEMTVSSVSVGSTVNSGSVKAIVDTGTTLIGAPSKVVEEIASQFSPPLTYDSAAEAYLVSCSKASSGPNVVFNVGGSALTLTSSAYVFSETSGGQTVCFLGFFGVSPSSLGGASWLLGDVFLRQYVTTFVYSSTSPQLVFHQSA